MSIVQPQSLDPRERVRSLAAVLEGACVRLEPLRSQHADGLSEVGLDASLWRFHPPGAVTTSSGMHAYVESALRDEGEGRCVPFAIIDRTTGRLAGSTRYWIVDPALARVEIGSTWLGREFQRTAINTEAKRLLLAHAFERCGLHRVELKTDARNDASRRAMARLGLRQEGTLRRHMRCHDGHIRDSVYFAVTDIEWPQVRAHIDALLRGGAKSRDLAGRVRTPGEPRCVLGVLAPYFNTTVEDELADLRPSGVSNQTARFTLDARVVEDITIAAERLVPCAPDAFLLGLSTESIPGGLDMLQQTAAGIVKATERPVFDASQATVAALRALDARSIGVVTPFDERANSHVRMAFEAQGFEVRAMVGLACPSLASIGRTPASEVRRGFMEADDPRADALVQIGTGLPVLRIIDDLERAFSKPVVACNAAMYWQALRALGIHDRRGGYGRLFSEH